MNINEVIKFATKISQQTGEILLRPLNRELKITYKKGNIRNLVTEIDQKVENFLVKKITEQYPDHRILTEETGRYGTTKNGLEWIIDPIDGTTNFSHGYPFFAISMGLREGNILVGGVVYAPALQELYIVEKGKGAFLNGKSIHVSHVESLKKSMLATGFGSEHRLANMPNIIRFHEEAQAVRRAGSAALDLCHVAAGRLDGYWEFGLNPWDIAAGVLMVEEAGGKITNTEGELINLSEGNIIASNGHIHEEMVSILNRKA